jgi:hypothetical protein
MMKTKKILLLTIALMGFTQIKAYDFTQGGIYYRYVPETEYVEVTYNNDNYNTYSGTIVIPGSVNYSGKVYAVARIGEHAFFDCNSLVSVTIPNSVTAIGELAFGYSNLASITIPASVNHLRDGAFYGCSNLTSFSIPNSVTRIGKAVFLGCSKLSSLVIPDGVKKIEESTFYQCTNLASVTIPGSVQHIGRNAFAYCTHLASIALSDSITVIDESAFCHSGLVSADIPNSVTEIQPFVFANCNALTAVSIPPSITQIGNGAFYECSALSSVTIPTSVKTVGDYAFYGCKNLTSFTFPNQIKTTGYATVANCVNLSSADVHSLTGLGDYAFLGDNFTTIKLPAKMTSIGKGAFYENKSKMTVTVYWENPLSVPTDDDSPFAYVNVSKSTLIVPLNTVPDYKAALVWKDFGIIRDSLTTGINDIEQLSNSYIANNRLYINSPVSETIFIYSLTGNILRIFEKREEKISYSIEAINDKILIVKGSSGWAEKFVR